MVERVQPKCINCKFAFDPWIKREEGQVLECRRYPPSVQSDFVGSSDDFPNVDEDQFCGEFVAK